MPLNARALIAVIAGKGFAIPEGGWTASTFAIHGATLIHTLVRASLITRMRAAPLVARKANELFTRQLDDVIRIAVSRSRKGKATIRDIMLPGDEHIWAQAIQEVFANAGVEIVTEIVPPIQSTLGQAYSKTSLLLGQEADPARNPVLARDARQIGQRIVGINETTRQIFEKEIQKAIAEGKTIVETAKDLREALPEINAKRQLTIARTELNVAWTRGAAAAFMESKTISHVSVIGCQARELNSPHFLNYGSTCNIKDVPVALLPDLLEVGWHVNHSGSLIPSGFRTAQGHA